MQSAILTEPGRIEIREIPVPRPSAGELLIEVRAALTCGTDLKAFARGHSLIPMPGPFGHEFSGVVAERGKGVRGFRTGDPIMAVHSGPCLSCSYCKREVFNLCENLMSTKVLGAFSEYVVLPSHIVKQNVFPKPEGLTYREAAFLEPLACVVHGMAPLGIKKGDTVLVIGSGPIGLLHLLLAKAKGAKVLMTGLEEKRLETAMRLGAVEAVRPSSAKGVADALTRGAGVDYVFECTGQPAVWESSVDYVRRGGTVTLFGGCKAGAKVTFDAARLHYDEITLRGTFHFTPADVREAYELLRDRKVVVKRLISGAYPLGDIHKVFDLLSKGEGIKYALVP